MQAARLQSVPLYRITSGQFRRTLEEFIGAPPKSAGLRWWILAAIAAAIAAR